MHFTSLYLNCLKPFCSFHPFALLLFVPSEQIALTFKQSTQLLTDLEFFWFHCTCGKTCKAVFLANLFISCASFPFGCYSIGCGCKRWSLVSGTFTGWYCLVPFYKLWPSWGSYIKGVKNFLNSSSEWNRVPVEKTPLYFGSLLDFYYVFHRFSYLKYVIIR